MWLIVGAAAAWDVLQKRRNPKLALTPLVINVKAIDHLIQIRFI